MAASAATVGTGEADRTRRVVFIDVLKGLMTLGMIYGHVACLLGVKELSPARAVMAILSIFTFPGFLFCFGYAAHIAYFSKDLSQSWRRLLGNGIRILVAFYVSAAAFRLLVSETTLSAPALLRILTLTDVPPYSEFLIAFALYMLLAVPLFYPIRWLLERPLAFWSLVVALLLTTLIPYEKITSVHLGLLIGTTATPTFPIVQFAPYFLLGVFFRRHALRVGPPTLIVSAACSSVLAVSYAVTREIPATYPPGLAWVLGSPLLLCLVYLASQALAARPGLLSAILERFGQNVLFCLLASNLMLFALQMVWPGHVLQPREYVPLSAVLIATIYYLLTIIYRPSRRQPAAAGGQRLAAGQRD